MDNKSILMLFVALIAVFVCSFTLSLEAVENSLVMYGVYAFIGFVLIVVLSLYESMLLGKDGSSTAYWFRTLSLVSLIVLVWYCTRLGVLFGWW
ncbi:MAG TPA: hypothetical protein PLV73_04265 [Treponemataceae bacterium]|jgi:hypothetical protein|nr:hypothetical protein [Treponema sp.]HOU38593.1 hypothetical protein [Treponemataceae bacterium]HPA10019.1 hypothetical protein [Treponemataceae bacterium]HPX14638.1 hypothetical protein [Treponemataceae bacterium]HQB89447.1 hypothetical protein [Treponemataceae bacterium]